MVSSDQRLQASQREDVSLLVPKLRKGPERSAQHGGTSP